MVFLRLVEVTEIAYHSTGSISDHTQTNEQFSDSTGDLVSFYSATTKYDTQGNVVYESSSYQNGADGQIYATNTTYNSAGKRTKVEEDTNGDGTPDVIHTYGYNDDQEQILEESDLNGDGEIDTKITLSIVMTDKTAISSIDSDADGVIDTVITFVRDDYSNTTSRHIDEGNDGTFEEVTTWEYTYDSEGNVLSKNKVSANSPEEDQLTTFTYNDNGKILTYSEMFANSPEQNSLSTTTYDEAGNTTFYSIEHGVINTDSYYRYTLVTHDTFGGQTTTEYDSNNEVKSVDSILYDDRGNPIEESSSDTYESGISTYKTTWTYNSDDQVITESVIRANEAYSNTTYAYDEQGELILTTSTILSDQGGREGEVSAITYEYINLASWQALYRRLD